MLKFGPHHPFFICIAARRRAKSEYSSSSRLARNNAVESGREFFDIPKEFRPALKKVLASGKD
jgi:hypothetical protein